MRMILIAAAALMATTPAALAAPATVNVTIGPKLQKTAEEKYGVREIDRVAASLKTRVEKELARTGALENGRVDLVLNDAVPNRPTFEQLGKRIGLSIQSFGVGGADIEGQATDATGRTSKVGYSWYETDIRQAPGRWVWSDAERTFDRFARDLARGEPQASQ